MKEVVGVRKQREIESERKREGEKGKCLDMLVYLNNFTLLSTYIILTDLHQILLIEFVLVECLPFVQQGYFVFDISIRIPF